MTFFLKPPRHADLSVLMLYVAPTVVSVLMIASLCYRDASRNQLEIFEEG
ncbi:MAG: hypothetical protein QXZ58_08340 [Candidatus Nezhaarchaeales archaeon]